MRGRRRQRRITRLVRWITAHARPKDDRKTSPVLVSASGVARYTLPEGENMFFPRLIVPLPCCSQAYTLVSKASKDFHFAPQGFHIASQRREPHIGAPLEPRDFRLCHIGHIRHLGLRFPKQLTDGL